MPSYFCDGLKEVNVINGVARLEFHRLRSTGRNQAADAVAELVIALPLQGLVNIFGAFDRLRDQLIKEGILKSEPLASPDTTTVAPATSPNFP